MDENEGHSNHTNNAYDTAIDTNDTESYTSNRDSFISVDMNTHFPTWANPLNIDGRRSSSDELNTVDFNCVDVKAVVVKAESKTDEYSKNYTSYQIDVKAGLAKWTIFRRYTDFFYLQETLLKSIKAETLPELPKKRIFNMSSEVIDERISGLSIYLKELVKLEVVWSSTTLVNFLDNEESKVFLQIWTISRMRKTNRTLSFTAKAALLEQNESLQKEVDEMREKLQHAEMHLVREVIQKQKPSTELVSVMSKNTPQKKESDSKERRPRSISDLTEIEPNKDGDDSDLVGIDEEIYERESSIAGMPAGALTQVFKDANARVHSQDENDLSNGNWKCKSKEEMTSLAVGLQLQHALQIANILSESDNERRTGSLSKGENESISSKESHDASLADSTAFMQLLNYHSNVAANEEENPWLYRLLLRMDEIVAHLVPITEEVQQREDILAFMRGIVESSLSGTGKSMVLATGSFCTNTFISGEVLDLTLCVEWSLMPIWFMKVNEVLCMHSADPSYTTVEKGDMFVVSQVQFSNRPIRKIQCCVNGIDVCITANSLESLLMELLIENLDTFVGKGNLFKRSLFLIKCWIWNELPNYLEKIRPSTVDNSTESDIDNMAVVVMLCCIFNKFGKKLFTPIQALGYFFDYYSQFDWDNYGVSFSGPAPLKKDESASIFGAEDEQGEGNSEVDFKQVLNINTSTEVNEQDLFFPASILEHARIRFDELVESSNKLTEVTETECEDIDAINIQREAQLVFSQSDRKGLFNILHPFRPDVSLTHKMGDTLSKATAVAIKKGFRNLIMMCHLCKIPPTLEIETEVGLRDALPIQQFFEKTMGKIHQLVVNRKGVEEGQPVPGEMLTSRLAEIDTCLSVSELVLGHITRATSLRNVIVLILQKRGPLPVGEIGKYIQDIAREPYISKKIKTEAGGLKKLIESLGDLFVLGTEHPFNPTVNISDTATIQHDIVPIATTRTPVVKETTPSSPVKSNTGGSVNVGDDQSIISSFSNNSSSTGNSNYSKYSQRSRNSGRQHRGYGGYNGYGFQHQYASHYPNPMMVPMNMAYMQQYDQGIQMKPMVFGHMSMQQGQMNMMQMHMIQQQQQAQAEAQALSQQQAQTKEAQNQLQQDAPPPPAPN